MWFFKTRIAIRVSLRVPEHIYKHERLRTPDTWRLRSALMAVSEPANDEAPSLPASAYPARGSADTSPLQMSPSLPPVGGTRAGPVHTTQLVTSSAKSSTHTLTRRYKRFCDVFGRLGIPMVLCFLVSVIVSFAFALLQVFPLGAMNLLMGTSDLDNGTFWLPTEPPTYIVVLAASALVLFGIGYIWLILSMVQVSSPTHTTSPTAVSPSDSPSKVLLLRLKRITSKTPRATTHRVVAVAGHETTHASEPLKAGPSAHESEKTRKRCSWCYTCWQWLRSEKVQAFTSFTGAYHHYYVRHVCSTMLMEGNGRCTYSPATSD